MVRRALDRCVAALAALLLRALFRRVEVEGRERVPRGRPVVIVANHFNGFVDPVIVVHVLRRLPRFLAKAALWRSPLARPFLALAGMLPVQPPDDAGGGPGNRATFRSSHAIIRRQGVVALFPEGTTHDVPALAPIHTGAARIALGARAAGARGLVVVPVGMAFDDKLALRSGALARVGEPIDLDAEIGSFVRPGETADEGNRPAVRRLTAEIEARLRAVSPDYRDFREARVLSRAAEITNRTYIDRPHVGVSLAAQEELAQRLAYARPETLTRLTDALARYLLDLSIAGLRDHQLVPGYTPRQLAVRLLSTAAVAAVLAPLAVIGTAVNLLPYWAVQAAGRAVTEPVTKGTVRFLMALVAFPVTWMVVISVGPYQRWWQFLALLAVLPTTGLCAVAFFERLVQARRAWRGRQALRDRRVLLPQILADRARLVAAVEAAAAEAPPTAAQYKRAS